MNHITNNFLSVFLILSFVFTFTGCGEKNDAKTAVRTMYESLKKGDIKTVEQYIDINEAVPENTEENSKEKFAGCAYQNSFIDITSSKENEDGSISITASLTHPDTTAASDSIRHELTLAIYHAAIPDKGSEPLSPDEFEEKYTSLLYEKYTECFTDPETPEKTDEIIFTVKKEDGSWKITTDNRLAEITFGDFTASEKAVITAIEGYRKTR